MIFDSLFIIADVYFCIFANREICVLNAYLLFRWFQNVVKFVV